MSVPVSGDDRPARAGLLLNESKVSSGGEAERFERVREGTAAWIDPPGASGRLEAPTLSPSP